MAVLSATQRQIVKHPHNRDHLLVLASPGSGKTRVITERIGSLLSQQLVQAEHVLAMTFTTKAAAELLERLEQRLDTYIEGLWSGTVHAICSRILHEHGAAIGWGLPFVVYDERAQKLALRRAAALIGAPNLQLPIAQRVLSERKLQGLLPDQQRFDGPPDDLVYLRLDEAYRRLLAEERALDFDDLIIKTIELLRSDDTTCQSLQRRLRYLFIDEFHDLSPEQFELLRLLAPPRSPSQHVMVVADPDQAIYGWRNADAELMLGAYRTEYRPKVYRLEENYRSAGNIVRTAQALIASDGSARRAVAVHADELPVDYMGCRSEREEAEWLVKQVKRAVESGKYTYGDMAILYRTHKRADLLETALLREQIPLLRSQPQRFFDDPDVQSSLRYLALVAALHDKDFEPSLNWPRVLVDELTMLQLRRLARSAGVSLSELAKDIDLYADQVTPLTRHAIRTFLSTIGSELLAVAGQPIDVVVTRLLAVLRRRRSPIPAARRAEVRAVLDILGPPLAACVTSLYEALARGKAVTLWHHQDVDSSAAALIVEHTLRTYLEIAVERAPWGSPIDPDRYLLALGGPAGQIPHGWCLGVRDAKTIRFSLATQAWRLCQMLLMRYEHGRDGQFVVYDFETSGRHVNSTEIIELAAIKVHRSLIVGRGFHSMVRPKGIISPDATRVHGIRAEDVRNAPILRAVLPEFLAYLGNTILVGHNIERFDHQILRRVTRELKLPQPSDDLLDTCVLARRLLPGQSHRMEDLAQQFKLFAPGEIQTHRALDDVRLNARLLDTLLELLERDKEIEALSEVLPLVALGMAAAGIPAEGENEVLCAIAQRAHADELGHALLARLAAQHDLSSLMARLTIERQVAYEEDAAWTELSERWADAIGRFKTMFDDHSLRSFLRYTALASAIDYLPELEPAGRVSLMTIHAAKGMEWPLVFLIGVENGTLPAWHSAHDQRSLAEERRLLYVGMTRAKRRLCLSWASSVDGRAKQPCPFLAALPAELLVHRSQTKR